MTELFVKCTQVDLPFSISPADSSFFPLLGPVGYMDFLEEPALPWLGFEDDGLLPAIINEV